LRQFQLNTIPKQKITLVLGQLSDSYPTPDGIQFNRQDAEDHLRFLNRYIPGVEFEVLFDVSNELTSTDEMKPS
jgi:hypothetical protein